MSKSYQVRDYTPGDYAGIAGLWTELGMGAVLRGATAEVLERTLAMGGRLLLLEERPSGMLVGTSWISTDGRRLLLHHFGIRPSRQGRGLAKLLLRASLLFARERGMQIKLEVDRANVRAIALYRGAGFVKLGDYDVYILRDVANVQA